MKRIKAWFENQTEFLTTNKYIIAAGLVFTISSALLAFITTNKIVGGVTIIIFIVFLFAIPKQSLIKVKIKHKKKVVLEQTLFPWFKNDHSPKYEDVFPRLFIDPRFKVDENDVITDVTQYFNDNLFILGDAGAGKTTFLRTWFVFKDEEKRRNKVVKDVLLFDAKELANEQSFFYDMIKYLRQEHSDKYLLLIDSIDEAFFNDYDGYKRFILQLQELNNCSIWLGCRKDYYKLYSGGEGMNLTNHVLYIQEWGTEEIQSFINLYAEIRNIKELPERIENMKRMGGEGKIEELMRNPFQLSIIVFLAEIPEEIHIRGRYDLYEEFMTRWKKHEEARNTSTYSDEETINALFEAALCIYQNKKYVFNDVAENDTSVHALLQDSDEKRKWGEPHKVANEFYHRSLAEFILAKMTCKSMINMTDKSYEETFRKICKTKMKDDVTNFILDKFSTLSKDEKIIIKNNLQELYNGIPNINNNVSLAEQIIYFVTRLDIDVSDFIGTIINSNPDNSMIRLSLAYGCTLLENDEKARKYALEFAKSIVEHPNGEEAVTNRAWAVIYYGDYHGGEGDDEYSYRDEEKGSWEKVRDNRIERFKRENPRRKDLRFWVFDIPLFHNFLIDRDWNDISNEEYLILEKLQFTSDVFNKEEQKFLIEEHSRLLCEYNNRLQDIKKETE